MIAYKWQNNSIKSSYGSQGGCIKGKSSDESPGFFVFKPLIYTIMENVSIRFMDNENLIQKIIGKEIFVSSLIDLACMSVEEIQMKYKVTKHQSEKILAGFELGRRKSTEEYAEKLQIRDSRTAAEMFRSFIGDIDHEEFWVAYLNRSNKVIKCEQISKGGIAGTVTDIRIIMKKGIECLSCAMILCHNHPSENLKPSDADSSITKKLKDSGDIMDIHVLDHIIIGTNTHFSFADEGIM